MNAKKKALNLQLLLLLLFSVSGGFFPLKAIGQNLAPVLVAQNKPVFRPSGAPRTTSGGASRGTCSATQSERLSAQNSIVPLIPATDGEQTTEDRPTIFVYFAEADAETAEFSLWDENLNGVYQANVSLSDEPGIYGFQFPDSAPPLAVGQRYKWSIALICDPTQRSRDVVVEGWMQRTQLSADAFSQLQKGDRLQQASVYTQNQVWYEALATLAQMRQLRPTDPTVTAAWQQLLGSVGLQAVAQAPVVDCCKAQN